MKSTKLTVMFMAAVASCAALATSTKAQCGFARHNLSALSLPLASAAANTTTQDLRPPSSEEQTIVGLWDVKFISDNQLFDEGFDQYHSDGTEILNDIPPPASGNVC